MLTDHELDLLKEYILSLHTKSPYPIYTTTSDFFDFIDDKFSKYLSSDTLSHLKELVKGIPMGIIYNLDKVGIHKWADSLQKAVIVPANYEKTSAPNEVNRYSKRS